jgi:hypothetical protein
MRLLLQTEITRGQLGRIAGALLDNIREETFSETYPVFELFHFAPFLLAPRAAALFALPAFRDRAFVLSFTPFLLKLIGEEFNASPHGPATAEEVCAAQNALLAAWVAVLEGAADAPGPWRESLPPAFASTLEIRLFWAREAWGARWVRGRPPGQQLAWLRFLSLAYRHWPPFAKAVRDFFGASNLELFECDSADVRMEHAVLVLAVCRSAPAQEAAPWRLYLARVLADGLARGGSAPVLFRVVDFFTTLITSQNHIGLGKALAATPEIFLLAGAVATAEDGATARRFFAALFEACPGAAFSVGAVAEVVAGIRPDECEKLRLVLLWCARLGPQLQDPVAAAFDEFEATFFETEQPSELLVKVFEQLILVQAYD